MRSRSNDKFSQRGKALASLMYAAVYWAGPRWSETVVDNTRLLRDYLEDAEIGGGA